MKKEKVCLPHNSPNCDECYSGSVEDGVIHTPNCRRGEDKNNHFFCSKQKPKEEYSSPSEWPWWLGLTISLLLVSMMFVAYMSSVAERRCIRGAEKAGNTTEEIKQWCKDNF